MFFSIRIGLIALALSASLGLGFKDTSPFLLFSNVASLAPVPDTFSNPRQVQHYSSVFDSAKSFLRNAETDLYILLHTNFDIAAPWDLKSAFLDEKVKSRMQISEVVGVNSSTIVEMTSFMHSLSMKEVQGSEWGSWVYEGRATGEGYVGTVKERFEGRGLAEWVGHDESKLSRMGLDALSSSSATYTVIYMGSPAISASQEQDFNHVLESEFYATEHIDLRRDLGDRVPPKNYGTDLRPLFEKYQYFTPGIFMGLLTGLLMLAIGSVGLNAVTSLKVSYGAFDRENGPAAQKKQ